MKKFPHEFISRGLPVDINSCRNFQERIAYNAKATDARREC